MRRGEKKIKQHLFPPIETEKGFNVTVFGPGGDTAHNGVQGKESLSLFRPERQVTRPWQSGGSKGRVPGLQTHTHTPKHFISITNHGVGNMCELTHRIHGVRGCCPQ